MLKINSSKLCVITECIGSSFWKKLHALLCLFVLSLTFHGHKVEAQSTASYDWKNVAIGGGGFVSAIITSKTEQNLVKLREINKKENNY